MNESVNQFLTWLQFENKKLEQEIEEHVKKECKKRTLLGELNITHMCLPDEDPIFEDISSKLLKDKKIDSIVTKKNLVEYMLDELNRILKYENERVLKLSYYKKLSKLLVLWDKNMKAKMEVLFFIIEKNLLNYQEDAKLIDYKLMEDMKIPGMDLAEIKSFLKENQFNEFAKKKFSDLTEQEKIIYTYLKDKMNSNGINSLTIIFRILLIHCINKKGNLNENDIQMTTLALLKLGIAKELCDGIKYLLEKELTISKQKVEKNVSRSKKQENNYDYKALEKEVSKAVDLKDMFPKRPLSLEEKIYYLSILTRMNVSKEERFQFLRNCEMLKKEIVELEEYQNILNRLRYYEESVGLQSEIQSIEECLIEMTKTNPQTEEYLMWEEILEDILKKIEHWIPKNYEYEEEQVKLLLVQKEIEE